jgi:hypothetical protein
MGSTHLKGDLTHMIEGKMGKLDSIGGAASCDRDTRQDLLILDNTRMDSDEAMDKLLAIHRISRSSLRAGSVFIEDCFAEAVDVLMNAMRRVDEREWRDSVKETDKLMAIKVKALLRNDPHRLLDAKHGNGECVSE